MMIEKGNEEEIKHEKSYSLPKTVFYAACILQ